MDRGYDAFTNFVLLSIVMTFSTTVNAQNDTSTVSNSATTKNPALEILTTPEPDDGNNTTGIPEPESKSGVDVLGWIRENPEYLAMIGMGVLIVLLVAVSVAIVCHLTSRRNKKESAYEDKS